MKNLRLPDFLGIGAARCGTTWLSKNLESHHDVWIPRIKELHYFTRSSRYNGPSHLEEYHWGKRLFSRDPKFAKYRGKLIQSIVSNLVRPSWRKLCWDSRYLFRRPSDQWYASLFAQGRGKVTGEITPRYCELLPDDIGRLKELIPQVKIIFIMRNPVERIWSLIRYHEKRYGERLTSLGCDELISLADQPGKLAQSDYKRILVDWREVFPPEQFFVGFYDEIVEKPQDLLIRLGEFLGLPMDRFPKVAERTKKVFNASESKPMPQGLLDHLQRTHGPMIEELAATERGYFKSWLVQNASLVSAGGER